MHPTQEQPQPMPLRSRTRLLKSARRRSILNFLGKTKWVGLGSTPGSHVLVWLATAPCCTQFMTQQQHSKCSHDTQLSKDPTLAYAPPWLVQTTQKSAIAPHNNHLWLPSLQHSTQHFTTPTTTSPIAPICSNLQQIHPRLTFTSTPSQQQALT